MNFFLLLFVLFLTMGKTKANKPDSRSQSRRIAQAREIEKKTNSANVKRRLDIMEQNRKRQRKCRELKTKVLAALRLVNSAFEKNEYARICSTLGSVQIRGNSSNKQY